MKQASAQFVWGGENRTSKYAIAENLLLVHIMGLQTRAGTQVWVGQVWVRVQCEVPIRNPHPCNRFGGFSQGTIILITATVQFMPQIFKNIFTVRTDLEVDYHHNGSDSIKLTTPLTMR